MSEAFGLLSSQHVAKLGCQNDRDNLVSKHHDAKDQHQNHQNHIGTAMVGLSRLIFSVVVRLSLRCRLRNNVSGIARRGHNGVSIFSLRSHGEPDEDKQNEDGSENEEHDVGHIVTSQQTLSALVSTPETAPQQHKREQHAEQTTETSDAEQRKNRNESEEQQDFLELNTQDAYVVNKLFGKETHLSNGSSKVRNWAYRREWK